MPNTSAGTHALEIEALGELRGEVAVGPQELVLLTEGVGRTDIGVTGERHLIGRRKDAHACGVGGITWRQDKGRFGIVELSCDTLHDLVA
jgi:hypothetical protein